MVQQLQSREEVTQALGGDGLVMFDFFAVWCGPCKMIAPYLDQYAQKYPVIIYKIDVDQLPSVAEEYHVNAMPTFILFRNGTIVGSVRGADRGRLEALIAQHSVPPTPSPQPSE